MRIQIRLFASAREAVDRSMVELAVPDGTTIGELRLILTAQYPALQPIISGVRFAIDRKYVDDRAELESGAEVVVIPLVSGG